jgi:DNA-binding PadR family transcriptional regulator
MRSVLRYGLLGLLSEGPASGYDLAQRFKTSLNAVWPVSHPQVYTELVKMASESLVTVDPSGTRGRKVYAITASGKTEVQRWLTSSDIDRTLRSESLFRVFFFWLMKNEDLHQHLEQEKQYFTTQATRYQAIGKAKENGEYGMGPSVASARLAVEAGARLYGALAEWAQWVIDNEDSKETGQGR